MNNENFMGLGGFFWFTGVVEDRQDPLQAGRVRVRLLGHHTSDKTILPTEDLPWALVMLPVTASGVSGIGNSATGLLEGSWVFGFFRDNSRNQEPIILGSLPGRPVEMANPAKGFNDPNGVYPRYINEPDVNRLAVNNPDKPHPSLEVREQARTLNVPTADFNTYTAADGSGIEPSDGTTWSQPELPYAAVYPYNSVYESEAGHLVEFDDTKDNERIHIRHRTGTGTEIHSNGDQTTIANNTYNITKGTANHYITGDSNTTIDGHHKLFINKSGKTNNHYDIHIGPNASINIVVETGDINLITGQGKVNVNAAGDYNLKVGGNMTVTVAGEFNQNVGGGQILNASGTTVITGDTVNLNP